MADTMRKVKGTKRHVRETGRMTRLRDVECGNLPPSQDTLDDGARRLAEWLGGETRVMYDDEVRND
jgi:hypothetical protein